MRCNDCNKFVSFDTETEPEVTVDVDSEGVVTGDCRIVNTCAECGSELTEATMTVDVDLSSDIAEHRAENDEEPGEHDTLEVDADGERTERTEDKDRNGKPIESSRYMKRFYGASVTVTVECKCGEKFEGTWSADVQASSMDSLQ